MKAIYWFRQDLRLHDNPALLQACEMSEQLLPVVFAGQHSTEMTPWGFERKGPHRLAFENQALNGLAKSLEQRSSHLYQITDGAPIQALIDLAKRHGLETVFCESLPAPEEQQAVRELQTAGLTVIQTEQAGLLEVADLPFTVDKTPLMFTEFRKAIESNDVVPCTPLPTPDHLPKPIKLEIAQEPALQPHQTTLAADAVSADSRSAFPYLSQDWQGDEPTGLAHLDRYFASDLPQHYKGTRNGMMGTDYSTKFSPWLAVGSLSPRAIYAALVDHENRQGANDDTYWIWFELLWRDHFQVLMRRFGNRLFHRNGLAKQPRPINPNLTDKKAHARLQHWIAGQTGQPFIDAGMRELAATGYLSNRMRQNVASYLIHDLEIDWRAGAAWFEHALIDYAVSSNQGNWAYIAGVGSDPRGGRRFNPAKQARDYDPNATYQQLWATA